MRSTFYSLVGLSVCLFACSGDYPSGVDNPAESAATASSPLSVASRSTQIETGDSLTVAPPRAHEPRTFRPSSASPVAAGNEHSSTGALVAAASAAPGVTCSAPNPTTNYGTPSIANGKVSLVYWGTWTTHPYDAFWQTMGATPAAYNRLREYGVSVGSYTQRLDYTAGAINVALTEEQLKSGIQAAYGTYRPSSSDIFIVFLPSGTSSLGDNQYSAGGHHSSLSANGATVPWAVVEYSGTAATTQWRSSHELMEALTDPNATSSCTNGTCTLSAGTGWLPEIGDACNGNTTEIVGLTTQQFWSQSACRCVREEDLNNVDVLANGQFDSTVFRASNGGWYALNFSPNWAFGGSGDQSFAGDFNGDGRTEFALFRSSNTTAYVLDIKSGLYNTTPFGAAGDTPVPGDYDNPPDGKTDIANWQPSPGWRFKSSATGALSSAVSWGIAGDIPVAADYDNDGITDYAVVRPSNGTWYVLLSSRPGTYIWATWVLTYGDIPVSGDFNGDGYADWAFWRPSTGTWYVWYQTTSYAYTEPWGVNGDIPVARDVDGDWLTDLQVWRPSNGTWYTIKSSTWTTSSRQWGVQGDNPIGH